MNSPRPLLRSVFLLMLLSAIVSGARAQLVDIPDVGFRQYLLTEHPEVMVGNQLDTADPDLAAIGVMDILWVLDLSGIEYFYALETLSVYFGPAGTGQFPTALPPSLRAFYVSGQSDVAMPGSVMAAGLRELTLNCSFVAGTDLVIPAGVERLVLDGCTPYASITVGDELRYMELNLIDVLPVVTNYPVGLDTLLVYGDVEFMVQPWLDVPLPQNLRMLEFGSTGSTELPLTLPEWPLGLEDLNFYYISASVIPEFPAGLHRFSFIGAYTGGCLPGFPLLLEEWYFDVSGVGCLPNVPPGISDMPFPLCTQANSLCLGGNAILGLVYDDLDADGIHDTGEEGVSLAYVISEPGPVITSTDGGGSYSTPAFAGDHTVQVIPGPYQVATSAAQTASFPDLGGTDTGNDLGLHTIPDMQDLRVAMTTIPARPGFDNDVGLDVYNTGTVVSNATITFTHDPVQSPVAVSPTPTSVNGNVLEWTWTMQPGEHPAPIHVTLYTGTDIAIGTPLTMMLTAAPVTMDETPDDNAVIVHEVVVASYDPNDKRVLPTALTTEEIISGSELDYIVRFQNTGTVAAVDVIVADMLPAGLDLATFEFMGSSHPCTWVIAQGQLQVSFDQIMLPDSTSDEPGSHGYLRFRIAPVQGLAEGSVIENLASIYFDFNAPIHTEPAVFMVEAPHSIVEAFSDGLRIQPNPVEGQLAVHGGGAWTGTVYMEVMDVNGRVVLQNRLPLVEGRIDVSGLQQGLYLLRIQDGERALSGRFVKR